MTEHQAKLLSVTVPLAWGTSYIFMKFGMTGVPPLSIVALRCGIAFFLTAAIFHKRAAAVTKQVLFQSAVTGALLFGVFLCLLYGVDRTSASTAGFLQSTTVVIVPILHAVLTRKLPARRTVLGVLAVMAGLFLLNGGGVTEINFGAACCLFSAFLYAVHILVTKEFVKKTDPLCLGIWQLGTAALYALAASVLFEHPALPSTGLQWIGILGLAFICSAYGFVMQAVLQSHVSPETTGFMFSLEPVFTAIFAFLILGERMKFFEYLGAIFIFIGVIIANAGSKPEPADHQVPMEESICH